MLTFHWSNSNCSCKVLWPSVDTTASNNAPQHIRQVENSTLSHYSLVAFNLMQQSAILWDRNPTCEMLESSADEPKKLLPVMMYLLHLQPP